MLLLARRTERGTFKEDNYFLMVMDAKEAANIIAVKGVEQNKAQEAAR